MKSRWPLFLCLLAPVLGPTLSAHAAIAAAARQWGQRLLRTALGDATAHGFFAPSPIQKAAAVAELAAERDSSAGRFDKLDEAVAAGRGSGHCAQVGSGQQRR